MNEQTFKVKQIQRFPVKGLSGEPLESVELKAFDGIAGDRLFGFARYDSGFDPQNPKPLDKSKFVVLANEAALAGLKTKFDPDKQTLEFTSSKGLTHSYEVDTNDGRNKVAKFLHEELQLNDPEQPAFVSSLPHRFTDVSVVSPKMMNAVSILNLASVRDLEARIGSIVNPDRFRMNLVIDGLPAWSELEETGSDLIIGNVKLRILSRTKRCAATEVNPHTAERDLKLPYLLRREMRHADMGIYAEVVAGGSVSIGAVGSLVRA